MNLSPFVELLDILHILDYIKERLMVLDNEHGSEIPKLAKKSRPVS